MHLSVGGGARSFFSLGENSSLEHLEESNSATPPTIYDFWKIYLTSYFVIPPWKVKIEDYLSKVYVSKVWQNLTQFWNNNKMWKFYKKFILPSYISTIKTIKVLKFDYLSN